MTDDPDNLATVEAAATLKRMLADRRHVITDKDAWFLAFTAVNTWIQARTCNWATRRGTPRIGSPDAMTLGFTEAALPLIWKKFEEMGVNADRSLFAMSKVEAAQIFAIAAEAIEQTRMQTLEDPTEHERMPA
jgi:hypothetical protein